jgi:uncharacterized protein involved in outer membrane biogenesis
MKWLFKWALRLTIASAALLILLIVFKDPILRVAVERRIQTQTGLEAQIGKFSSSMGSHAVTIQNLKLYNTAAFGGKPFLDVPELHVEFDPLALAGHKLHITLMRLNLAELDIVKNEAGQTNVMSLLEKARTQPPKAGGGRATVSGFEFEGIDVLNLSLGKARFIDLKNERNNREIKFGLQNQVVKNVKSEQDLLGVALVLWLRSGTNFNFGPTSEAKEKTNAPIRK